MSNHAPPLTAPSPPEQLSAVIAGAQKSGTTSLLRYLGQHPQLCAHQAGEFTFFEDSEYLLGWEWAIGRYFYRWTPDQQLIAKYATLAESAASLPRLAQHSPDARLVMIFRDPVDRAFSSYRMERNQGAVVRPFDYVLTRLHADPADIWKSLFVDLGHYAPSLRRVYEHFDPDQVTVLTFEEFVRDPSGTCRQLFHDLGVALDFAPDTSAIHNAHRKVRSQAAAAGLRWLRGPSNPLRRAARRLLSPSAFDRVSHGLLDANQGLYSEETIEPDVRSALSAYYRPLNEELEELLGRDLSVWSGMGVAKPYSNVP